jgi:hypothetical protein
MSKNTEHAEANARGWTETITGLVGALEVDFERLNELLEMRAGYEPHDPEALAGFEADHGAELAELKEAATVDGELFTSAEDVQQRITEAPLSVQVRSGWHDASEAGEAEEFEILLSTGGPALRIVGELDEYKQPHRAWLEYQDWGTPWTHHHVQGFGATLLTFCQQFYFGE